MTSSEKIATIIAEFPVLTSYVFFYRALGLTDDQIVERFKGALDASRS